MIREYVATEVTTSAKLSQKQPFMNERYKNNMPL